MHPGADSAQEKAAPDEFDGFEGPALRFVVILRSVLVVFGQLDVGRNRSPLGGQLAPDPDGVVDAVDPPVGDGEKEPAPGAHFGREAAPHRLFEDRDGRRVFAPFEEEAAERVEVGAGERRAGGSRTERLGSRFAQICRQRGGGEDVEAVVGDDPGERCRIPGADELEVELRDEVAGHVVVPLETEDSLLEVHQTAAFGDGAPEASRRMQEVDVGQVGQPQPAEGRPRLQQRPVERPAVERDEAARLFQLAEEGVEDRFLFVVVAHEVLSNAEGVADEATDADQECVGAGAALEPGGLGVDEESVSRRNRLAAVEAGEPSPGARGDVEQVADRDGAAPVGERESALDAIGIPGGGRDEGAVEE